MFTPTILVRKILIKWWGKEDFFAEGKVYDRHGIIVIGPAKEAMKTMNSDNPTHASLLKELFYHMDKDTINNMWKEVFGDNAQPPSQTASSSKGPSMSHDDTEMHDQDAQDPYDDGDDIFTLLNN